MITDFFSPEITLFLKDIESLGFSLCLVGGSTRDFFYSQTVSNDLDFEIRPTFGTIITPEAWPQYYKKMHHYLQAKNLIYTELPYLITRVSFANKHFEFSSPRCEVSISGNFSHHHFKAEIDPNLDYLTSFKRRDFSINAIGIELSLSSSPKEKIIDPYNGMNDLKNGILRNLTDDFFCDSVRFMRLIRFSLKFEKFKIQDKLFSKLHLFNLTDLSVHHFKEELFKSRPSEFLNSFTKMVTEQKIPISEKFNFWLKYNFPKNLVTKEELLAYVFLINAEDAKKVESFFSLPEKKIKDLNSFVNSYKNILEFNKENFSDILALPMLEALKKDIFRDLKNLEDKKDWRFILNFSFQNQKILIDWDNWKNIKIDPIQQELIPPAYRSYYIYYLALRKRFLND
ncbi:MAG: hypothetical protein Q7U04_09690 [Bacteriovorax sp.]|nr:hypothetical protein [Bacteriovorax sp.]